MNDQAASAIPRDRVAAALGVDPATLPEGDLPLERFAARYLGFLRATYETEAFEGHPDYWTDLLLAALIEADPALAFAALCAALAGAADEEELTLIAAGPLEELLDHAGPAVLPDIEARAPGAPRLRLALGALWQDSPGKPLLAARLRALAGEAPPDDAPLPPPGGLI